MVDLSKHVARMKQALDRRNYEMVFEVADNCMEVAPDNLEVHRLIIEAAKRKAKEHTARSLFGGLSLPSLTRDPQKAFAQAVSRLAKAFDAKVLAEVGDAASKLKETGIKTMVEVAMLYYEEQRATGLFNPMVMWSLAHLYFERSSTPGNQQHDEDLNRAIALMHELDRAMPNHPDAGRTGKNWEAAKSLKTRNAPKAGDFTTQIADKDKARRLEMENRIIRTVDDAREVLQYIDRDLKQNDQDKHKWSKKATIHRQIGELEQARNAFMRAQALDPHDFQITMRLGDLAIDEAKARVQAAEQAGQDARALKRDLLALEIAEYRKRVERQPTDMGHKWNLGAKLWESGDVDGAAAEFQKTVQDPRLRMRSHRLLGLCFTSKKLLELASQQYTAYLALAEDTQSTETKEVMYLLARAYEDQGKTDLAIQALEKLVVIDLGFKDAAERLNTLRSNN